MLALLLLLSQDVKPEPKLARPEIGKPFQDPTFQRNVTRIATKAFPEYSKRQAWNSDESLLLLRTADGRALLFDGATYQLKKELEGVGGEDVFWWKPNVLLYNPDHALWSYDVKTDEKTKLHEWSEYEFANTRGEGNLSRDGKSYAFVGQLYANETVTFKDLVLFDLESGKIVAKHALQNVESFDWVSVSPCGKYVVVDYADDVRGIEVYDRSFKLLWTKPLGAGHSDLGDGFLVMDVYDPEKNVTRIVKYALADGRETELLEVSPLFDVHLSCRNEKHLDWVLVSTFDYVERLTHDAKTWLPFEDEIFALKLDGSREVRRLAHHHSRRYTKETPDSDRSVYFAEPHATVSRNGDRVLFGSNWGEKVADEASVDAYVIDLRK